MTILQGTVFRGPGEGQYIARDRPMLVKVGGGDTGNAYSMMECTAPAGEWTTRHIHHQSDEAWYVLEGQLTFQVGERTEKALPGSFALVPRGTVHAFGNTGSIPAKCLILFSPPGMEQCFAEVAALRHASADGLPNPKELEAVLQKYGHEIVESGTSRPW